MKNRRKISARKIKWLIAKRAETQATSPPWRAANKLAELPAYSQMEAFGRRLVIEAYYQALADELTPAQAERIARIMSLVIFDKALCSRTIRGLVARIEERGGIVLAPIEAFATEKSCAHRRKPALKDAASKP